MDYWLEPNIQNIKEFALRLSMICWLYQNAKWLKETEQVHVICLDEKTGIQAIERKFLNPVSVAGIPRKAEFEYKRNGTVDLLAAREVADAQIIHYQNSATHNSKDFVQLLQGIKKELPEKASVVFIADQYCTHLSEEVVCWVAQEIGFKEDLGKKGCKGILQSKESRRLFLEKSDHQIQFFFTPKHCSWMNQIENWFSLLTRHALKNASFESVKELEERIIQYIGYYNKYLAKPMNWRYTISKCMET